MPETFELLRLAIVSGVVTTNITLAAAIYRNDPRSATHVIYGILSALISIWLIILYFFPTSSNLLGARLSIVVAMPMSYAFFLLAHTLPEAKLRLSTRTFLILTALTLCIAALNSSSYAFKEVIIVDNKATINVGLGMIPFGILSTLFSVSAVILLLKKYITSTGALRDQVGNVMAGVFFMLTCIITTIFIPVVFFQNYSFIAFSPLYALFFLGMTGYAIVKHHLFNLKLIATELFVAILGILFFARTMIAPTETERFVDAIVFVATVFFGVLLVRSVKEEVRAREEVGKLAKRLTEANWQLARTNEQLRIIDQRKSEFVSIVSHQLRTPITAIKGYSSLILEDSYGKTPEAIKEPVEKIFISAKRLADMVTDFLDISKIEHGTMSYNFTSVDMFAMLRDLADEFAHVAHQKHLTLHLHKPPKGEKFIVTADEGKIRQILSNIMDNSIKYTLKGGIDISMEKDDTRGFVIVKIKDTGIGLSQDDIHHLFGKFTRGSGGQKQNTDGSGLGLYVAQKLLEAHRGRVWVDSEGVGKGSTFIVELCAEEEAL